MLPTCSCKHRRCVFDVIMSLMVWVIHRRYSPMFPNSSAKHRRCYDDAFAYVFYLFSPSNMPMQLNKSDFFFIHDLIRQPQGMWFHLKSLLLICYRQGTILSPWLRQDVTTTSSRHYHYASDASTIFVWRTPKNHWPSPILKINRWMLAESSPICITKYLAKFRRHLPE